MKISNVRNSTWDMISKKEFDELAYRWEDETVYLSSVDQILEHEVVEMLTEQGERVLPWIMERMRESKMIGWIAIANIITGVTIVPKHHMGMVKLMIQDWIHWYDNIYSVENPTHPGGERPFYEPLD